MNIWAWISRGVFGRVFNDMVDWRVFLNQWWRRLIFIGWEHCLHLLHWMAISELLGVNYLFRHLLLLECLLIVINLNCWNLCWHSWNRRSCNCIGWQVFLFSCSCSSIWEPYLNFSFFHSYLSCNLLPEIDIWILASFEIHFQCCSLFFRICCSSPSGISASSSMFFGKFGKFLGLCSGCNWTSFWKSRKNFWNATVRNLQCSRNNTWFNSLVRHVDNLLTNFDWESSTIDENTSKLVKLSFGHFCWFVCIYRWKIKLNIWFDEYFVTNAVYKPLCSLAPPLNSIQTPIITRWPSLEWLTWPINGPLKSAEIGQSYWCTPAMHLTLERN